MIYNNILDEIKTISDRNKFIIHSIVKFDKDYDLILKYLSENNINIARKTVQNIAAEYRDIIVDLQGDNALKEFGEKFDPDGHKGYIVNNGYFIVNYTRTNTKNGEQIEDQLKLPVEKVDDIASDFSTKGANLTQRDIQIKYGLKSHQWNILKGRLQYYKNGHVVSEHSMENKPEEYVKKRIEKAINDKYSIKNDFIKLYNNQFDKKAKEALDLMYSYESLISFINERLQVVPFEYKQTNHKEVNNFDYPVYLTSDYHFGEEDDNILEQRLSDVFSDMIEDKSTTIRWFSLGDLGETFLEEGMHPGQIQRMETYGFDLVIKVVDIFSNNMKRAMDSGKKLIVEWQGGNHDRMGKTNDMDRSRTWALIIGEMIQRTLSSYIDNGRLVFNNEKTPINKMVIEEVKTVLIGNHGDGAWYKKNTHEIISLYGKGSEYYNILLEGDKHHFEVKQDTNSMRIVTTSIKSGGSYAEDVIYKNGISGYTKIVFNDRGTPQVMLRTFGF